MPGEYAAVFKGRRVIRGERFDLHYLLDVAAPRDGATGGSVRLGLVVPKRMAKAAVLRNTVKRQAREAFRHMAAELPAADLVLKLGRSLQGVKPTDAAQRRQLRAEIEALLRRFGERRDTPQ